MGSRSVDQEALAKLMSDGWSWWCNSDGGSFSTDTLVDPATGKHYKLHVNNGNLTMTEVTSE
jgi:hypothetical protein